MTFSGYGTRFAIALGASLVLTLVVRSLARRFHWVAKPRADRWHKKPTALYGGVGIFGGFVVSYATLPPEPFSGITLLGVCAAAMFLLGLIDDRLQLKPYAKLVGQLLLAILLTRFGLRLHWLPNPILDELLTLLWLVGVTNALNLLDHIDGAAAGITVIAALFLVHFCDSSGRYGAAGIAAALAGAALGFLVYNFNPASIFMGDCGSLFLGFLLGGLALATSEIGARRNLIALLAIPVLLLLIPIVDTTLVTISRRYHGRRVSQGGRDHTSHRLVALGLSERAATLVLWGLAAISGGVAVLIESVSVFIALSLVCGFGLIVLFLMIFLGRVKVYESVANEGEGRGRALLPTLADFTYKRRIFEVLNDLVLILLAFYSAMLLRLDGELGPREMVAFLDVVPIVLITQLTSFLLLGLYRGVWRYTSLADLRAILQSVGTGVLASLGVGELLGLRHLRAVFIIDGILLLVGVAGTRLSFRLLHDWLIRHRKRTGRRTLIYGAGDAGVVLVRELTSNDSFDLVPVGFIDDDPQKLGRVVQGLRVLGPLAHLDELIRSERAEELVVSTSKIPPERLEQVTTLCQENGLSCRRMRITLE